MERTWIVWGAYLVVASLFFPGSAAAQGQSLGNGVYVCDGAAQAGPCQPDGGDYEEGGGTIYVDVYGAHAVDLDKRHMFWALGADSQDEARSKAISKCEKSTGTECRSLGTFQNTCLAYAFDTGGTGGFPGYGPTAGDAAGMAMGQCNEDGGGDKCYMMALPVCTGIQYRLSLVNLRAKRAKPEDVVAYAEKFNNGTR